jgi:type III secretion protein U
MSESSGEKTEEPTPKKLKDARKRGEVGKSADPASAAVFIMSLTILTVGNEYFLDRLGGIMLWAVDHHNWARATANPAIALTENLTYWVLIGFVVAAFTALAGIVAMIAQVGIMLAPEALGPKFEKLNPGAGLKQLFSMKNFVQLLKTIIKAGAILIFLYIILKSSIGGILQTTFAHPTSILSYSGQILLKMFWSVACLYLIIAVADFAYSQYEFKKGQRMTKKEVEREHKQEEGDPQLKFERKEIAMQMIESIREQVKKSSVIVTNPNHIAVCLQYVRGQTPLPIVIAKGADETAELIKQIAKEEGIPVFRDIKLARQLYKNTPIGQYIGEDSIEVVAAILRWVQQLHEEAKEKESSSPPAGQP